MMRPASIAAFTLTLLAATPVARAQTPVQTPAQTFPVHIPTSNGEVILATAADQKNYEEYGFAGVRRVGDLIYISGVIAGRRNGQDGTDVEAFKAQVRRAFTYIERELKAAGVGFDDVAMLNTFHVWQGPNFTGSRDDQFKAFEAVKGEFMKGPHPAWTAVGTTGLLADGGIVEIQMIAKAPR
jgi:enamine deaminase RidA (YjgF/YER057c/UK114 family)